IDESGAVAVADGEAVLGVDQQLSPAARVRAAMLYDALFGTPVLELQPTDAGLTSRHRRESTAPYGVLTVDVAPGSYVADFGWAGPYGFVSGAGGLDAPARELDLAPGSVTNLVGPGAVTFSDVSTDNAFWYEISWLAATQVTQGYPDGTFGTWTPVS